MVRRYAYPVGSWSLEASDYGVICLGIIAVVLTVIGIKYFMGI